MHLILSFSFSYPYLIKFHDFADKNSQPGGDEASNEGSNSGPTGHDFTTDNSNISGVEMVR
jgi:hypothetical protein